MRVSPALQPTDIGMPVQRYREIGFCPRCGAAYRPEDFHPDDCVFVCPACTFDFYQNPLPSAVVVLVHPVQADALLIMKRRTPPGVGTWCVPGGFIRYGESPEAAAAREVREEVGIDARIGPVLRVGLLDYPYRGRQLCVLEVAYLARLSGPFPAAGLATSEASEIVFRPVGEVLDTPGMLAFPEQAEVLRAFQKMLPGCRPRPGGQGEGCGDA